VRTIGEPLEAKQCPDTGYQAQFSGPYAVAAGLHGGSGLGLGLADFTDDLARDPSRRELMSRITVGADERCDAVFPAQFPAVLTVYTTDGRTLEEEVMVNRGGPDDPLSADELAAKFADNVEGLLDEVAAKTVVDAVAGLAELDGVEPLMAPLRRAGTDPRGSSA
jgi:2-methylcitrate dehydratase PrpD